MILSLPLSEALSYQEQINNFFSVRALLTKFPNLKALRIQGETLAFDDLNVDLLSGESFGRLEELDISF